MATSPGSAALAGERDAHDARLRELERERDELAATLRRERRERDDLVATIAHELRSPIAPVALYADLLLSKAREVPPDGAFPVAALVPRCELFVKQVRLFLSKLARITDAAQLGTGDVELALTSVDLAEVVCDVVARVGSELSSSGSSLSLSLPEPVVGLWDRLRLEQILANLLSNAIRYGEGKAISIEARTRGELAELTVTDGGMGIAEADQKRIFDRFARGSARGRHPGLGIGLWVVRTLCHALGGTVTVASRPGAGARFTVVLPRSPKRLAPGPVSGGRRHARGKPAR